MEPPRRAGGPSQPTRREERREPVMYKRNANVEPPREGWRAQPAYEEGGTQGACNVKGMLMWNLRGELEGPASLQEPLMLNQRSVMLTFHKVGSQRF